MKAMILAAGFGTRLGELGKSTAKCLIEAGGKPLLEHVIDRLKLAGVNEIVINLHHLGEQVRSYVKSQSNFGLKVSFSEEQEILGTGGGILQAQKLLSGSADFIVHNGDIFSDVDLTQVLAAHRKESALATLVVQERAGSRPLLFSAEKNLAGWENKTTGEKQIVGVGPFTSYGFSGIQIISQQMFSYLSKRSGSFSSISSYIDAAKAGEKIRPYIHSGYWLDVGTPERLAELKAKLGVR